MTDEELVSWFWGKAGQASEGLGNLHPALFHMLVVGFCAQALVERNPLAALRGLWPSYPELAAQIGFLVALHDLGKISPAFQLQREDLTAAAREAGLLPDTGTERNHSRSTWLHLKRSARSSRTQIAHALGAHHGTFQSPDLTEGVDGKGWIEAREAAIDACARAFGVDAGACLDGPPLSTAQVMVLAGVTAVADWLGSDRKHFPREGPSPRPLREYALARYTLFQSPTWRGLG